MGNRNTPPRSFNTVKHSNREVRRKRHQQERMTLLSIFTVAILILLLLLIFLVCSITDAIKDRIPKETQTDPPPQVDTTQPGEITYAQITKQSSAVHTGDLILVNADHEYVFPSGSSHLVNIADKRTKVNGENPYQINRTFAIYMQKDAFAAMEKMMLEFYRISDGDGSVMIKYSYRTLKDQEDLNSVIQAGYSDHHTGYCIALHQGDVSGYPALDPSHWIYENCHKFGFIARYPVGKEAETGVSDYEHCFRYVGVAHATYIESNGYCLEEYVELLKSNYTDQHLSINGADGNKYEVYYVPASAEDITTVKVPSNYEYTISGDNDSGFIVTVNLSAPIA